MIAPVQNGLFAGDSVAAAKPKSTMTPPPKKYLERFHVGQIGDDTIRTFLEGGFSLGICCRDCKRLVEITPPELQARFGDKLSLRIADLCERLSCKGAGGCGSKDIAVFPHLYDDASWRWTPPAP